MPELPEVEITTRAIKPVITDLTLKKVLVRKANLRWEVPLTLKKLKNVKIKSIHRRAKYILLETSRGVILIHLGMSGRLSILQGEQPPTKHDHLDFIFSKNIILRYNDPRRFGSVHFITEDINQHFLLSNLGPEPLSNSFTASYLYQLCSNKKANIKQVIMNQRVVVGVGNIYANEVLFRSQILPFRKAADLSLQECAKLCESITSVLTEAIKKGGTTLKDFLSPQGDLGYFSQKLLVYGRDKLACTRCKHSHIESIQLHQRVTYYCAKCQK